MTTSVPTTPAVPRATFTRSRLRAALAITVAAMTSLGACASGPINVGTLPISGSSIMSVNVQTCAPRAGALLITADYHQIAADWVQVKISRWAPSTGSLPVSLRSTDRRHWEFTTPPVEAGDCFHIFINTVSMCCDPVEPPLSFGFSYRIDYLD
jgi:hypothetical protein